MVRKSPVKLAGDILRRQKMKKKEYRKLVSTCITFAFAGVALTGLIAVFGVRGKWMDIHLMFGLFFLVAAGLHVQINWPILMKHLQSGPKNANTMLTPMTIAAVISVIMLLIGLISTPSKAFRDFDDRPHYGQAEKSNLAQSGSWKLGQGYRRSN